MSVYSQIMEMYLCRITATDALEGKENNFQNIEEYKRALAINFLRRIGYEHIRDGLFQYPFSFSESDFDIINKIFDFFDKLYTIVDSSATFAHNEEPTITLYNSFFSIEERQFIDNLFINIENHKKEASEKVNESPDDKIEYKFTMMILSTTGMFLLIGIIILYFMQSKFSEQPRYIWITFAFMALAGPSFIGWNITKKQVFHGDDKIRSWWRTNFKILCILSIIGVAYFMIFQPEF